ncbi:hypothetical protein Y032_0012g1731 [Ancylostoma ceylanicum]|uniref:Uncharacterized protein n=1 Tax=Ancylostoma ceylanicum TaxID=53326 RepID=A0A016VDR0_9BILA|nr:hypothetical protein Y032_0012g1731 [Ancylostoma ceylanicum]
MKFCATQITFSHLWRAPLSICFNTCNLLLVHYSTQAQDSTASTPRTTGRHLPPPSAIIRRTRITQSGPGPMEIPRVSSLPW